MLEKGDKAPDPKLTDHAGKTFRLKDYRGKKIVLYFYPKDDTPGCTKEACAFQEDLSKIRRRGAVLLGVSPDSPASHEKFRKKYGLKFPLISDPEKELSKAFGVWQKKKLYGREYMGVVRSTFLIDEKGKISQVFPKVKVAGHADEVLAALS